MDCENTSKFFPASKFFEKRYTYYRTIIYKVDRLNDYFDKLVLVGDISNENFDINTKIDIQNQKQNYG